MADAPPGWARREEMAAGINWAPINKRGERDATAWQERRARRGPRDCRDNAGFWGCYMFNDFCTEDGAKRLARMIEEYWRDRGYTVDVKLIEAGFMPAMRAARTDVRSNMVNGFPRRESAQPSEMKRSEMSSQPLRGLHH